MKKLAIIFTLFFLISFSNAENEIIYNGLGNGNKIIDQYPKKGVSVLSNDKVILTTNDKNITLPSLENWSKKDCINLFNLLKIKYSITGDGFVTSQSVEPGEVVTEGMEIEIELKNKYIEEAK